MAPLMPELLRPKPPTKQARRGGYIRQTDHRIVAVLQRHCRIGRGRHRARGAFGRRGHHLVRRLAPGVVRVGVEPRPQEDRHHVRHGRAGDADARLHRRGDDAQPAGDRLQQRRLSAAGPFRPDLLIPRHHHDLLHGDAVLVGPRQSHHAAADRLARRRLPVHELREPVAHHRGRRPRAGVARDRQVLHGRLDRLPALLRGRVHARRRRRLLALGGADLRYRLDHDRHQFPGDDHQDAARRACISCACRCSPGRCSSPACS